MAASLEGVLSKIERAAEHHRVIVDMLKEVSRLPIDHLRFETDDQTGETVHVLKECPEAPARVSAAIGDCIHNYRSALDHLAWQLVKHPAKKSREKPPEDDKIAFPIYTSGYSDKSIRGCTPGAKTIVDGLQPYHAGQNARQHPLAVLNKLSNWDKHRVIHAIGSTLEDATVVTGQQALESFSVRPPGPLVAGAELLRFKRRVSEPEVTVSLQATIGVAFRDAPVAGMLVTDVLGSLNVAVTDAVVKLTNELELDGDSAKPPVWANFL